MNACLAKPIDWWTIQMARRCTKHCPAGVRPEEAVRAALRETQQSAPLPLAPEDWSMAADGRFRFRSPMQTEAPENNTVFGQFFPAAVNWAKRPTVILLHGWNAELCYRHLFPYLASMLGRAGINTAMLELPYHMQRRPRLGTVRDFISSDVVSMLEAARQGVADTLTLSRWFWEQGAGCVGLWGFSLGAWLAGLSARSATELGFAVLTTPIVRLDRVIAELPFCEPVRRAIVSQNVNFHGLNLSAQKPTISTRNVLLVEAIHDLFAPAETVEELWHAWGKPEIWRLPHGHISVLFSMGVMRKVVGWIESRSRAGQI